VELLSDPLRAVTTDYYNTLLVFDIDRETTVRRTIASAWAAVIVGHIGERVIARLHAYDPMQEPWFDLAVVSVTEGHMPVARLKIAGQDADWIGAQSVWSELPRFLSAYRGSMPAGRPLFSCWMSPVKSRSSPSVSFSHREIASSRST
jgi:hypothetical protein